MDQTALHRTRVNERTRDIVLVGLVALLLRIPAFLSFQQLGFDDGQFAESVLAMRAGGLPFREVFSSQGPLFLPMAWLGDLLTGRTIDSPRTIAVLSGVALTIAVYCAARELTTRAGALLAAVLVTASGSVLWTTGPLTSDGLGEAFATGCVAVALAYRRKPSVGKIVAIGVLAGAAFSVKSLLEVPALLAAGLLVIDGRRIRHILAVPAIALAVAFVIAAPWGLQRVYDQSVTYHTDQAQHREIGANADKTLRTLVERDAPLVAAGLVAIIAALIVRRRSKPRARQHTDLLARLTGGLGPIVLWLVLSLTVLLLEAPMWRNHLAHVAPAAALLVGVAASTPRIATVIALAALVVLPWHVSHLSELLWPRDYTGVSAQIVHRLRKLPPGAQVISDDPGLVWRAGKRTPDRFVDVSILRIHSRRPGLRIDQRTVVRAARNPVVCAVVQVANVRFGSFHGLHHALERSGYRVAIGGPHHEHTVWVRRRCDPTGRSAAPSPPGPGDRTSAMAAPSRSPR
jgi:4-amino-4-deoxy-L-arabinose transferase-like glycosyltransferase